MKWDRSFLVTLVYSVFAILYTLFIINHSAAHRNSFGTHSGTAHPLAAHPPTARWGYYLGFLLVGNYLFFLLQGLVHRSKNWGLLLLLPVVVLAAAIVTGYLLVGLIRLGGGDLLDRDSADMILATLLVLVGDQLTLRWVRPRGSSRHGASTTRSGSRARR